MTPLTYLACPYWHPDPAVREDRYQRVTKVAAVLMKQGVVVFSPITHCHPMHLIHDMPGDWKFWEQVDRTFLERSTQLVVLILPGWTESIGVNAEIRIASEELTIPVTFIDERSYYPLVMP